MARYIVANVTTTDEAQATLNNLMSEGFPKSSVAIVTDDTNQSWANAAGFTVENGMNSVHDDDESLWQRIKDFFGADDEYSTSGSYSDLVGSYRDDIQAGNILIVVDDAMLNDEQRDMIADKDIGYWANCAAYNEESGETRLDDVDSDTLQLEEERMSVNKENVEAGEVVLHKRVVEENQTINVPLRHEEVVIERTPVNETRAAADGMFQDDTITIPIYEEQASVTKTPVVTEEIHVRKQDVERDREFSANLRKEKLDVDKQGNVVLNDDTRPTV